MVLKIICQNMEGTGSGDEGVNQSLIGQKEAVVEGSSSQSSLGFFPDESFLHSFLITKFSPCLLE